MEPRRQSNIDVCSIIIITVKSSNGMRHGCSVYRLIYLFTSELVQSVPVLVYDVGELIHVAVGFETGVGAHQGLGLGQPGVALDRVINVHQVRIGGAEYGVWTGPDELLEQVHVLVAPAPDGRVEATDGRQIGLVHGDDTETVLPPVTGVLVDEEVVGRRGATVHDHRVVFAVHDREVHGLAADRVQPDAVQERGRPQHVHVDKEQQVVGRRANAFRAHVQRHCPGERVPGIRQYGHLGARVLGREPGHRVRGPLRGGPAERHDGQRDALQPLLIVVVIVAGRPLQAHRLVVVHEPSERGQPVEERQHEMDRF